MSMAGYGVSIKLSSQVASPILFERSWFARLVIVTNFSPIYIDVQNWNCCCCKNAKYKKVSVTSNYIISISSFLFVDYFSNNFIICIYTNNLSSSSILRSCCSSYCNRSTAFCVHDGCGPNISVYYILFNRTIYQHRMSEQYQIVICSMISGWI